MAKSASALGKVVTFVAWLTGVIVALAVGFALIDGVLGLPVWLGGTIGVSTIAGWVVVITTLVGAVLAIVDRLQ